MKKYVLAVAATGMLATPAMATPIQFTEIEDQATFYRIQAQASDFCEGVFGNFPNLVGGYADPDDATVHPQCANDQGDAHYFAALPMADEDRQALLNQQWGPSVSQSINDRAVYQMHADMEAARQAEETQIIVTGFNLDGSLNMDKMRNRWAIYQYRVQQLHLGGGDNPKYASPWDADRGAIIAEYNAERGYGATLEVAIDHNDPYVGQIADMTDDEFEEFANNMLYADQPTWDPAYEAPVDQNAGNEGDGDGNAKSDPELTDEERQAIAEANAAGVNVDGSAKVLNANNGERLRELVTPDPAVSNRVNFANFMAALASGIFSYDSYTIVSTNDDFSEIRVSPHGSNWEWPGGAADIIWSPNVNNISIVTR